MVNAQPTQEQMFYQEQRKLADSNTTFLDLVNDGMTREELARNIERRPSLWSRFSTWLDVLPSSTSVATAPPSLA